MIKPWSISTTIRNPERIRDFLLVLKNLENYEWNLETQKIFQILLIQNRLYGYGNKQFLNNLSPKHLEIFCDINEIIPFKVAEEIFTNKGYEDPAMRGRQSLNPLKKLGFVLIIDNKIVITELGKQLIGNDYDIGDIFFRCFIKWQIPNLLNDDYKFDDGYDIVPFIGTIKLFYELKKIYQNSGKEFKGLNKEEFNIFVPTLINYKNIQKTAEYIYKIRTEAEKKKQKKEDYFNQKYDIYLSEFLNTFDKNILAKNRRNLRDYGDNILRYFRLTRYFYIRGNGYFIDLEPRRLTEIEELVNIFSGSTSKFASVYEYLQYVKNINQPALPWEDKRKLRTLIDEIEQEIIMLINSHKIDFEISYNKDINDVPELIQILDSLRKTRKTIQAKIIYNKSKELEILISYIDQLKKIYSHPNKALELERLITLCLYSLNDALLIKPNYPVGDDNEPIHYAPANTPDIECYYESFNSICEVTMLKSRDQWFNEGQPVMRHLREFEEKSDLSSYCIFVAPTLHRDTLNTFWIAVKYEYEGKPQKIIPLTINQFIEILNYLKLVKERGETISHLEFLELLDNILAYTQEATNVNNWVANIPIIIEIWGKTILTKEYGH